MLDCVKNDAGYTLYNNGHSYYIAQGVSNEFVNSVFLGIKRLHSYSVTTDSAISGLSNVIILKDSDSILPDVFQKTSTKLHSYAEDASGFVSRADNAIVIIQDNHKTNKNEELEGDFETLGEDTATHEGGHIIDDELSSTDTFKNAYMKDLQNILTMLNLGTRQIMGEDLEQILNYLKHYMEGVNFTDGIDDSDITREGLRENFAECVSTELDTRPSKINAIFSNLFKNSMRAMKLLVSMQEDSMVS